MIPHSWQNDTLLRRLAGNAGWLVGGKAANALLSLAVLAVAARALGPDGLGRLVLMHGFVQLVAEVVKFQSWQGVVRYGAAELERADGTGLARLVGFSLCLDGAAAAAGTLIAVLAGPPIALRMGWSAEVAALLPAYGAVTAFLVFGTAAGLLRLFNRFDLLAGQSAVANGVRLAGCLAAWAADGGIMAFALAWGAASAVAAVMPFPWAWRELARRGLSPKPGWPRGITRAHPDIWRFSALTSLNSIIAMAPGPLALLMVGSLLGPSAAGLFRVARQFADASAKPAEFLAQALYPEAARLNARDEAGALARLLRRLAMVAALLAAMSLLLLGGLGRPLLDLTTGPAFVAAYPTMVALAVGSAFLMASAPVEPLLIAGGRAGVAVAAKGAGAALHLAALVPLVRAFDLWGAGVAAGLAGLATFSLLWLSVRRGA